MAFLLDRHNQQQRPTGGFVSAPRPVARPVRQRPAASQQVAVTGKSKLDQLLQMSDQTKQQEEENKPPAGGILGRGLGMVLNNPVVNTALRPLDVLDVPRRAVWSTVKEVKDAATGGEFSFQDWYDQTNPLHAITQKGDVTIGAGSVIPDVDTPLSEGWDKWINRGVGLTGDIVADPLTYVSGIGFLAEAGVAGGRAGRALAGSKARDAILKATGGIISPDQLDEIQRVVQRGYHEASPEMLDRMGVSGGIRMGIPFTGIETKGVLPGVTKQTSRARAGLGDVADKLGLSRMRTSAVEKTAPKEVKDAYTRLFRNQGPLSTEAALEVVASDMPRRRGQGALAGTFGRRADELVKESAKLTPEQKADVLRQLETPGVTPTGYAAKAQQLFEELWQAATKAGVKLERRENYSPHVLTRDAIQWLRSSGDEEAAQRLRGLVTEDLFAPSGVTMHRKFRPGETIELNGRNVKLDNASIEEINQAFRGATGKNFNLYESDPGDIIQSYINMLSSDVGTAVMARERAAIPGTMGVSRQATTADGKPLIGTTVGDEGEQLVSELGDQQIRPPYQPGQNASRVSEPLPTGAQGPVLYGQTDLETLGQRLGQPLSPEQYRVTKNADESTIANQQITASLMKQRDRLAQSTNQATAEIARIVDELPVEPLARFNSWNDVSKKLTEAKNQLIAERDKMVRMDGGWAPADAVPGQRLQAERAKRVGTLEDQARRAEELEQQIVNIEAGVELYDRVIEEIMADVAAMDRAADKAATRKLGEHATRLRGERETLYNELQRIVERQSKIPKPWVDDPGLLARQADVTSGVAAAEKDIAGLTGMYADDAGVPAARAEVERLKAARSTQTAPTEETKAAREFLASTPDIEKYDNAQEIVARQWRASKVKNPPSQQRAAAARRFIESDKGQAVALRRQMPDAKLTRLPENDVKRFDEAEKILRAYETAKAAPSPQELKDARRFLRTPRGKQITEARRKVGIPDTPNTASIEGRIRAAEQRLADAEAAAAKAAANDPAWKLAQERLTEAQRATRRPSAEGQINAASRTFNPAAARTPNIATPNIAGTGSEQAVRGIPLSQVGDMSDPAVKATLDIPAGQNVITPGSPASREVAEATRRHLQDVTDPGEAERVKQNLLRAREDTKATIRRDAASAAEKNARIKEIDEALMLQIPEGPVRDNLRQLFRQQFADEVQGEARATAQNAFDELLSGYMVRQASEGAQEQIAQLRDKIDRLRRDVPTVAETVPPAIGSQEALLARQAEQGAGYNRSRLNLPGGTRGTNPMVGERTLAEIDADIAAERQRLVDAVDQRGQRMGNLETAADYVGGQKDKAAVSSRAAHQAQTRAQSVVEDIKNPAIKTEAGIYSDELAAIANDASLPTDAATANLLENAVEQAKLLEKDDLSQANVNNMIADGKNGKLTRVVNIELADGLSILEREVLGDDFLIHDDIRKAFQYVREAQYDKDFWPVVDGFTNFFKTYATLTPGFHVRNAMSAVYMNSADGVPVNDQREGLSLMNSFLRASKEGSQIKWLEQNGARVLNSDTGLTVRDAFDAAFGSGIGGRYRERGFADRASLRGKASEWLFSNRAVDLSKRAGGVVEGGVRLPVALDTIKKGGGVNDAMERINRLHFDYSRTSQLDEKARKLIPFWTFMSRNLPLQISMMWQKPRMYAWYESFVRNFEGESEPGTPEYFDEVGAFRFADTMLGGLPMYLQPDLPHKRIEEDMKRYENALTGKPGQFLTDFNPMFTAPVEFATGTDFFTGRTYDETDKRFTGGLETPVGWASRALGQGEMTPGGQFATDEKFISLMRSLIPVYDRSLRVAPGITAGGNASDANSRQLESYLRLLGAPVRQLSPQQQQSTLRGQYYDQMDEQRLQQALMALDAQGG